MADDTISRKMAIDTIADYERDSTAPIDYKAIIKALPTVDAVEIIRCKDCKHYQFSSSRVFGFTVKRCEITGFEDVDDDDFCSRAERRQDDKH